MNTYITMHHPIHTRTYKNDAQKMAIHEITYALPNAQNPHITFVGNVPYLLFNHEDLTPLQTQTLSRLTCGYGLFEYHATENKMIPLQTTPHFTLDESISSLLKYSGKTNEIFTRLLLQLACANVAWETPLTIVDPLAGKGTTLYEALLHGHHAYGIEIDPKYPFEADQFLKKFLTTARIKHTSHQEKIHGAPRFQITLNRARNFEIIQGDTRNAATYFKKNTADILVADLPYGVQHASKTAKKKAVSGFTRNATALLMESLPGWLKILKPNGVIALAWNTFLIPRANMSSLLTTHQLQIIETPDFSHRVDQAIERDVIIAAKTNPAQ